METLPAMAKTMLLVEDSITTQKAVITALEHEPFDIITANDAAEALRKLENLVPDIILVDAAMSDIDGFRFCKFIREAELTRQVPVLLLTSSFTSYDPDRGHEVGVTAHLAKPFEPQALRQLVQQLVAEVPGVEDSLDAIIAASSEALPWGLEPLDAAAPAGPDGLEETGTASDTRHDTCAGEQTAVTPEAPITALPDPMASRALHQFLGDSLLHMIRQSLHDHLGRLLTDLTPQILKAVHDDVEARMPALLEALLQREIDKLKQAVEHDAPHGDQ